MSRDDSEQGIKLRKKKKWIELAKQMNHYERNIDRSAEELEQIVLPDNVRNKQIHKVKMIKCIQSRFKVNDPKEIEKLKSSESKYSLIEGKLDLVLSPINTFEIANF